MFNSKEKEESSIILGNGDVYTVKSWGWTEAYVYFTFDNIEHSIPWRCIYMIKKKLTN